ncbi:MAG TPA: divalent-cation tolerance protein CutA [Candidatus Thermoplasmatota archaeon]|nr:divalent-cation tolerance protein CutA [Candidatus Thermoplasmatota archaeon]
MAHYQSLGPSYVSVYITAPDKEAARVIARTLIEENLAACVNFFPIVSMYRWEGQIEESIEMALIAKTRADVVPKLMDRVKSIHPHKVPCAVVLPQSGGMREYYHWIDANVSTNPKTHYP